MLTSIRARLTALLIAAVAATTLSACDSDVYVEPASNEICVDRSDRRAQDHYCESGFPNFHWWYLPAGTYVGIGQRVTTGNQQRPARVRRAPTVTVTQQTTTPRSTAPRKTTTPKATPTKTRARSTR
ncbi:hypothetical protein SEA_GEAZY_55 [Gordonia phage GEazy]|nr:hypothetical protein SEA_GEAZY_55 [Gordonia phage GEazy]QDF16764.1 hypothetical protein SEA_HANNAHD_52 [Gordonia phage HannahD]